jgi:pyrroloquinoline quinone biosynthesis protein B
MRAILEQHEPWRGLVRAGNVELRELTAGAELALGEYLSAIPIAVTHRGELSETVGFIIRGPRHAALYIPDIDGWEQWNRPIEELLGKVDVAYLDGTFYSGGELGGRDMRAIPHPCISESIARFAALPAQERAKVRFLHFNHTNPVLRPGSEEADIVAIAGHRLADEGEQFEL